MTSRDATEKAARPRARVLVVEDNADLAFGLQRNLEFEGYGVEVVEDGESGLERLRDEAGVDLVILDLMLPGLSGFEVLDRMREEGIETPVLILTARGEETDKVRGLRSGADDYVTKPFGVLELVARVEAILRRAGLEAGEAEAFEFGDVTVDTASRTVTRGGEPVALSPKEYALLVALLRADGAALSRLELLRDVWGYKAPVETRTVDTHIAELRRKLEEDSSKPRHIRTVRKHGYRLEV